MGHMSHEIELNTLIFSKNANFLLQAEIKNVTMDDQGNLKKKTIWNHFTYFLGWKKSKIDQERLRIIIETIKTMFNHDQYQLDKLETKSQYKKLIAKCSLLDKNLFIKIFPNKTNRKNVENYLSEELKIYREEKEKKSELKKDDQHQLKRKIVKARLALELGIQPNRNKGANGTTILHSTTGKALGVFKVGEKDAPFIIRIKNMFKRILFGQLSHLKSSPLIQPQTEVACFLADTFFGFHLTPPSKMTLLGKKKGAFQLFLKDYQEAKEKIDVFKNPKTKIIKGIDLFQKMAIFDYLIGNLDRHEENWLVKLTEDGSEVSLQELKMIDNANSLMKKNPSVFNKIWIKSQYKWKHLPLAQQLFSPELKEFVQKSFTPEKIEEFIDLLNKKLPQLFDPVIEKLFRQRLLVIMHLMKQEKATPALLGSYVTNEEILNFLKPAS
jgi:hypothetical protein